MDEKERGELAIKGSASWMSILVTRNMILDATTVTIAGTRNSGSVRKSSTVILKYDCLKNVKLYLPHSLSAIVKAALAESTTKYCITLLSAKVPRGIAHTIQWLCDASTSASLISRVTNRVNYSVNEWRHHLLDPRYPILHVYCIFLNIVQIQLGIKKF